MDEHTISLIRESFDLVEPIAPQAAVLFCNNLLAIDPTLRPLFADDLEPQANRIMQGLASLVACLDRPETLDPLLDRLGRRLAATGLGVQQYDAALRAWLQTLHHALGVAYNDDVETAWMAAFNALGELVRAAARLPRETTSV